MKVPLRVGPWKRCSKDALSFFPPHFLLFCSSRTQNVMSKAHTFVFSNLGMKQHYFLYVTGRLLMCPVTHSTMQILPNEPAILLSLILPCLCSR